MPNPNLSVPKDVEETAVADRLSICPQCSKTQIHSRVKVRTNIKGYITAEIRETCQVCGSTKTIIDAAHFGYKGNQ